MENIDIDYIKIKLLNILKKAHSHPDKQTIRMNDKDIQFACPICGDSQKSNKKHRGHLYLDNLFFKCWNEGCRMSFTQLCKNFNEEIDINERIKIYNYVDSQVKFTNNNSDYILSEMDLLIDLDKFVDYFNNKPNSWLYDIKPVEKNSHVYQYLKYERLIEDFSQIYQGIYRVIKNNKTVFQTKVMINLNMLKSDKKLLGIQLRNLEKDKSKRFFKIVDFEELYNYINPSNPIDEITALPYNKLSHFFNILNIDFEQPITIFESFIDSLFMNNSIGLIGTNSVNDIMNFLVNSDDSINIRFFLDNDAAGDKKNEELLKKGHTVFLWNKLFDKLIEKSKDKYKAMSLYKDIKDLNELVIKSKNSDISNKLKLDTFFSKDIFDILYINKKSDQSCQKNYLKKRF
jgi:hypothetical protein